MNTNLGERRIRHRGRILSCVGIGLLCVLGACKRPDPVPTPTAEQATTPPPTKATETPSSPQPAAKTLAELSAQAGLPDPPDAGDLDADLDAVLRKRAETVAEQRSAAAYARVGHVYRFIATNPKLLAPAVQCYTTAQSLEPDAHTWPYHLGQTLFAQGEYDRARAAFSRVAELNPEHATVQARLGEIGLATGDAQAARDHFMRYTELRPNEAHGFIGLAVAHKLSGEMAEAMNALRRAVEVEPADRTAHIMLADAYTASGDTERAAEQQSLAEAASPSAASGRMDPLDREVWHDLPASILEKQLAHLVSSGQLADAEALGDALVKRHPDDAELAMRLGVLQLRSAGFPVAVRRFEQAIRLDPQNARAHDLLARTLLAMGLSEDALRYANRALELDPQLVEAYHTRANILLALDRRDNAELALRKATEVSPDQAQPWLALADFYLAFERDTEAEACFERVLQLDASDPPAGPESAVAYLELGKMRAETGAIAEAEEQFRAALRIIPNNDRALAGLGYVLNAQGHSDQALQLYRQAADANPNSAFAHATLAGALSQRGRRPEEIEALRRAADLNPSNGRFHLRLGELLAAEGKDSEAMSHLQAGLVSLPREASAHYLIGVLFHRTGDTNMAKVAWDRAMDIEPTLMAPYLAYTQVVLHDRDWVAAEVLLRDSVNQLPDTHELVNRLAWLLATCPDPQRRNAEDAVRWAEHACALTNNHRPDYLFTLAAAYAESGQFDAAAETQRRAITMADETGRADSLEVQRRRLSMYESGQAFHEE
ncbi:MAG: tetratricopeptide repeat protein [bacterium]|nr:tetratricopeptide repeat protein [bacterium]